MGKRIMTIDELYNFCLNNNVANFDSHDFGTELYVEMLGNFEKTTSNEDKLTEGMTPFVSRAFHDHVNLNHTSIPTNVFKANVPTSHLRPILANIVPDKETNELDFDSHDYHIEEYTTMDDDGNEIVVKKKVFDEQPIGVIDGTKTTIEYDRESKVHRAVMHGYLYDAYCQDAIEILNRRGTVDCSVELTILKMTWDSSNKVLVLNDFYVSGLTLLGKNRKPGMKGSNFKLEDFTDKNNAIEFSLTDKMINLLEGLDEKLSNIKSHIYNFDTKEEGGNEEKMFEQLLEKYGKTAEDITFEYADLSDEELEAKFIEVFGSQLPNLEQKDEKVNITRTYEISHEDLRYALYELLRPFEEAEDTYYWINNVYDDYFIYENYNDKIYRQNYIKDNETDTVTFDGERIELFRELLTANEKAELEAMRSNYEALKEFKDTVEKNELHSKKEQLLADEKYSVLSDNEIFNKLVENMDNYALDELEKEAKVIFADYVSSVGSFSLKDNTSKETTLKLFSNPNSRKKTKSGRYGDIFKNNN